MCVMLCVAVLRDASQAPGAHWDLPHWVRSAPLASLSSLDKDRCNPPHTTCLFSLSLSYSCIIFLSCLFPTFYLPASPSIFVPSCFFLFFGVFIPISHINFFFFSFLPLPCIVSLPCLSACGLISLVLLLLLGDSTLITLGLAG